MSRSILERLVVLSSHTLTRRQEVDSEECEVTFVTLTGVFDGVDVERHRASQDGHHHSTVLGIHHNLQVLDLERELVVALVRLETLELLDLAAVRFASGLGETSHALLLLLGRKLLLMLASLRVCDLVHLRAAL